MRSHGKIVVGITAMFAAVAGTSASLVSIPRSVHAEAPPVSPYVKVDAAGNPVRWNPCASLQWKIAGDPPSRRLRLAAQKTFHQIAGATGLRFAYAGRATAAEFAAPPRDTIVIGATSNLGLANAGGMTYVFYASTAAGGWTITGAKVAINPLVVARGTRFTSMLMPIVLHEVGHAVGLAHVSNPTEIMYPQVVRTSRYTVGARATLRHLGASMGCSAPAVAPG